MNILPSLNEPATLGNVLKLILLIGGASALVWYGLQQFKKESKPKARKKKNPAAGIPVIDNSDDEEETDEEWSVDEDSDDDVEELAKYY